MRIRITAAVLFVCLANPAYAPATYCCGDDECKGADAALQTIRGAEGTGKPVSMSGAWRLWCEHGGTTDQIQGRARIRNAASRPEVLRWNLPYEMIIAGVHDDDVPNAEECTAQQ
jgi:hypothetical protein